jgi:hypothetical protein
MGGVVEILHDAGRRVQDDSETRPAASAFTTR